MDSRKEKTRASIKKAFLQLYPESPLKKITVKELCDLAGINKSTFYCHYTDVYDLCDQLQDEAVEEILESISSRPISFDTGADELTKALFHVMYDNSHKIQHLFSGGEQGQLVGKLEKAIKELVFKGYPRYREDPEMKVLLDFAIYGSYYAREKNQELDREEFRSVIQKITATLSPLYK